MPLCEASMAEKRWKLEEPDLKGVDLPGDIRFNDPNFAMRVRNNVFQVSYDRGHTWSKAYDLTSSFQYKLTSRTDYLVNGDKDCFLFLSAGNQSQVNVHNFKDRAFCPHHRWRQDLPVHVVDDR